MAKILITSVGTGDIKKDSDSDYKETAYVIEGKKYKNTLTSQVICEHYNIEKVFFIGTVGSMWDNLYYKYGGEDGEYMDNLTNKKIDKTILQEDLKTLEKTVDIYLHNSGSKCFLIEYNKNDFDEIWTNFEKILSLKNFINDDDEIYIDITHGFRYMPILNLFAFEFIQQLNDKIKPKAILYGMFGDKTSNIFDFNIFFELLEWAKAIEELENFASINRLLKLSKGKIEKNGYNQLKRLDEAFSIANLTAIQNSITNLKNHISYLSENSNKIIKLISPNIENFIKELDAKTLSNFQFKMAEFFSKRGFYSLAYIALAEAIVSYICEKKGLKLNSKEDRDEAKDAIYRLKGGMYHKFYQLFYQQINRIRNNIAHQLETTKNPKDDIENFDKYLKDSKKYLKKIF